MKICLFGDARAVHIQRLVPALAKRGLEMHVVCHKPVDVAGASVERFCVRPPGLRNPRRWHGRRAHYLRSFLRRFDAVNIHFLWDWGFTPEIMDHGCVIASPWGSDIVAPPGADPPPSALTEARISLLRHAGAVTACGPTFARTVADFADIDVGRIDVLPLGVDLDLFQPKDHARPRNARPQRVGFFKGFREVYGPTYLIQAIPLVLRQLPETRFELVGDGPQLLECRELAAASGVESSIEWIPRQPHLNIPDLLARWDLTVIPSVCEAFGVAALESSAMRVPVVASNVGGLPDTVRDGETGLLVPSKSPEALADGIVELLRDTRRRLQMGKAGREWVRRHFDWNQVIDQWERGFHKAIDRTSRARRGFQPARRSAHAQACGSLERSTPQRRHRRVLMVACAFPPTGGSGVQRSVKFAKFLPQFGWLPVVWTVSALEGLPRDPTLLSDLPPEVTIHTTPGGVALPTLAWPWAGRKLHRTHRVLRRLMDRGGVVSEFAKAIDWRLTSRCVENPLVDEYVSWARASVEPLCRLIRKQGIEVIYSTYSPVSNHLLALMLKRRTSLPWIADFRDLWTDDYRYCESSPKRRAVHRRLEQEILETADVVVGVTNRQTAILAEHVPTMRHKFVTITNGFDPADFPPSKTDHPPARACGTDFPVGLGERFVLAHVGRLDRRRASDRFLAGLRRFVTGLGENRDRFVFRIVGHANEATCANVRATGVQFSLTGYVPHAEAVREMHAADALLLSVPQGPNAESIIPGKLFEYLASQRPVLVVGPSNGESERIVRSCHAGLAGGLDGQAISLALGELFDAWQKGRPLMGCPPNRLEPYSRVTLTRKLASVLNGVIDREMVDCRFVSANRESSIANDLEACVR